VSRDLAHRILGIPEQLLFPASKTLVVLEQLVLGALAAALVCVAGPGTAVVLVLALILGLCLVWAPSRLAVGLFVAFMVTSQEYRSLTTFHLGGIVWHPRELVLIALLAHWAAQLVRGKVRIAADPTHLAVLVYALFFVQIGLVGLLLEPDLHRVVAECRYPLFIASYVVLVSLIRDRKELSFYVALVFWATVVVAGLSIAFFAYTLLARTTINTQNAWGAFVPRQFGPMIIQSVRPRGHMFYEVCITALASLLFCPGLSKKRRLFYLAMMGMLSFALLIMFMRTAYAALFVSLAALAFLALPRRAQFVVAVLGIVLSVAFVAAFGPALYAKLHEVIPSVGASIEGRIVEIAGSWRMFMAHPILGAGMGSGFKEFGAVAKTSQLAYAATEYRTVHNVWMYYLFKGGFVGFVLVACGLGGLVLRGYAAIPQLHDPKDRCLLRGLVAGLCGQLVASLAMPRLTYPVGHVFIALMACAIVVFATQRATPAAERTP